MARRRKNQDEVQVQENKVPSLSYSTPSQAYSQDALDALASGNYKEFRKSGLAARQNEQAKQGFLNKKEWRANTDIPSLVNARQYQQNLDDRQKSYEYDEQARKNNTLEKRDSWWNWKQSDQDYLQRIYDNFGEEGARRALKQSSRTKDWEQKYGKSYDQILDDFLADQKNITMQMGESHPFLTEVGTALNSIPVSLASVPSLITNLVDPGNPTAQKYEQMRAKNSENQRLLREGVKKNTGDYGDKAIDMLNSIGDRLVNTIAGDAVVKGGGAVMAGLSEANKQMDDLALRPDMDGRKKALSALGHGAIEGAGTALVGGWLDKIPGAQNLKGIAGNLGKGAVEGAAENVASEVGHNWLDDLIYGDNSQANLNKQLYMAQGMSEEEADKKVNQDRIWQYVSSGLMGAGFGAGMRGAKEIGNVLGNNRVPALDADVDNAVEQAARKADEVPTVTTNNVEVPPTEAEIRAELNGANRVGIEQKPDEPIILPGTQGVIELPENKRSYIDGLRESLINAEPLAKAEALVDGGYYSDIQEAGKAFNNGTLDSDVEKYLSAMERNGDPTPTKAQIDTNDYDAVKLQNVYNGDWDAMRKGTIKEYTGADDAKVDQYYNELETFFTGHGSDANTEILDDYVDHAPAYKGEIRRGMHFGIGDGEYDKFMSKVHEGGSVTLDKPSSWASDWEVARRYSHLRDPNCDSVEIVCTQNRTSTPVSFANFHGEDEVLSSSKASWTVLKEDTSVLDSGAKKTILYVAEMGEDASKKNAVVMPEGNEPNSPEYVAPDVPKTSDSQITPGEQGKVPFVDNNPPDDVPPEPPTKVPFVEEPSGNGKKTKTSEAYTNTARRGKGWTEEEYKTKTNASQFQYETKGEEESINEAAGMLSKEGFDNFRSRVMDKERLSGAEIDGLMMEWRILAKQARDIEASGQDASAAWAESIRVFRKIQEQSTSNAQALQALAKWSRNTPEGMLSRAESILNGKTKVDESAAQKVLDKFAKGQKKGFKFSDEFVKDFLQKAQELDDLDPDSREYQEALANLGRMVNSQLPSSLGEKVQTVLMDNMLGNFRTLIARNAGGNVGLNAMEQFAQRPLAALIDKAVAKKTGKRTQAGLSREGLVEYINGFTKGLKDEAADFKTKLHTARSGEASIEEAIRSNRHVFKEGGVMDKLDNLVKTGLSIGDRPFYEAVYNQSLGDYARLRASGQMGDLVQSLSDAEFDEYAKTAAKMNALAAVYQQDSKLSNALLNFKESVGKLSEGIIGTDILSQFSMPFVKTPANVVERAIDYSPLGFVRNAFRTGKERAAGAFDQNRFVNETSRNIIGTGLMAGGVGLGAAGGMSGAYSDDVDEKKAQKESGMQEYALNLPGGKQMDIGWIPVLGSNLVAADAAYEAYKNGQGDILSNMARGVEAGGQALFDQSMFQGLQRLFGSGEAYDTDTGIVGNMANVVKSGFGQAIPSLARQIAQVSDPYKRDLAYSNEGTSAGFMDNYDLNSLANNIPILREMVLAPQVNTSGELEKENQGRNVVSKVLEDMILPGKITQVEYSALNGEAQRLKDATTSADAYMPKASRKYLDTDQHTLTNDEWSDYQQNYYGDMTTAGNMIINSDAYKNADDETKVQMLKNTYNAIRNALQSEYTGKEQSGAAKKYLEAGGGEKGVKAVVDYYETKAKADSLGMQVSTYEKKEAEYDGGAVAYAQNKQTAEDLGISTSTYDKVLEKAGQHSAEAEQALPVLAGMGLPTNALYTYANALQDYEDIDLNEFAQTYNEMNTDGSNGLKEKEILDYINSFEYDDPSEAEDLWYMFGDFTNKKGERKKIKNVDGVWKSYY